MKHHQSGYAFATVIAVLLALIPFAVVGSHYLTKPKESIVIGSSTKKQILVLSEREALALIANYPPGEPDAKIVQSMRDIAGHTRASQALLPGIKPKVQALPSSKYLVKIQLDGEWVAQPARYDTFAEALEAAKEYAVPTLVRPAKETERSPEVSVAAPEKRDSHFGGDSYEASLLRDLLARIHGDGGQMLHRVGLDECFEAAESVLARQHDLQDVRCECCGYMTYHREHTGCIRAARAPADSALEAPSAQKAVSWARPVYATEPVNEWEAGDLVDIEFYNHPEKPEGEDWRPLVFADTGDTALASAAQPAPATQQAGWKCVPVEPTDAMVQAAHHIDLSYMPGQEGADRAAIYRAMLAAAPHPSPTARKPLVRADYENRSEYLGCASVSVVMRHGFESGVRFAERYHGITED